MILQGNNINNLMNLKNFKNENLNLEIISPNTEKPGKIIPFNGNKNNLFIKNSESITNSNLNTNTSTIHKSDSLTQNFQVKNNILISKEKTLENVKKRFI